MAGVVLGITATAATLPPEQVEFFENKVRPVLAERCYNCHAASAEKIKGGLRLDTRDELLKGGTTGPAIEQIESAKAVCETCDVKDMCLDFALTTNQDSGIWGGTSEEERRKIRRQWLAARRRAS